MATKAEILGSFFWNDDNISDTDQWLFFILGALLKTKSQKTSQSEILSFQRMINWRISTRLPLQQTSGLVHRHLQKRQRIQKMKSQSFIRHQDLGSRSNIYSDKNNLILSIYIVQFSGKKDFIRSMTFHDAWTHTLSKLFFNTLSNHLAYQTGKRGDNRAPESLLLANFLYEHSYCNPEKLAYDKKSKVFLQRTEEEEEKLLEEPTRTDVEDLKYLRQELTRRRLLLPKWKPHPPVETRKKVIRINSTMFL